MEDSKKWCWDKCGLFLWFATDTFHASGLFLSSLENNRKALVSWCFSEYGKRAVAWNGLTLKCLVSTKRSHTLKYVWPFNRHQALKGYTVSAGTIVSNSNNTNALPKILFHIKILELYVNYRHFNTSGKSKYIFMW